MIRSAARPCRAGCGRVRQPWADFCRACWRRLPDDVAGALIAARQAKVPHRIARTSIAAMDWLRVHSPAAEAARRIGEK